MGEQRVNGQLLQQGLSDADTARAPRGNPKYCIQTKVYSRVRQTALSPCRGTCRLDLASGDVPDHEHLPFPLLSSNEPTS